MEGAQVGISGETGAREGKHVMCAVGSPILDIKAFVTPEFLHQYSAPPHPRALDLINHMGKAWARTGNVQSG